MPESPMTNDALQSLLHPITVSQFRDKYFGCLPLRVKGSPKKFKPVFGWHSLAGTLQSGRQLDTAEYGIKAALSPGNKPNRALRMMPGPMGQLTELLQTGTTVCVRNIHLAEPILQDWLSTIRKALGYPGDVGVTCYISPNGSGFAMHYDARVAIWVQVAGKTRWKYSAEPAREWPDRNAVHDEENEWFNPDDVDPIGRLPSKMEFNEVDLESGDLLCLPAGTWHSVRAVGHSLALNLCFEPDSSVERAQDSSK